jgi:hypothetical protein
VNFVEPHQFGLPFFSVYQPPSRVKGCVNWRHFGRQPLTRQGIRLIFPHEPSWWWFPFFGTLGFACLSIDLPAPQAVQVPLLTRKSRVLFFKYRGQQPSQIIQKCREMQKGGDKYD